MNEENEWDHNMSAGVKEGPADCIRMAEVRAVLKKIITKNCSLSIVLTATDQKPQKSFKR